MNRKVPGQMAFCLTCAGDRGIMSFCWEGAGEAVARQFLGGLEALPTEHMATAVGLIALAYSENAFLRPSWWRSLSSPQQRRVQEIASFDAGGSEEPEVRARILSLPWTPFRISAGVRSMKWL